MLCALGPAVLHIGGGRGEEVSAPEVDAGVGAARSRGHLLRCLAPTSGLHTGGGKAGTGQGT